MLRLSIFWHSELNMLTFQQKKRVRRRHIPLYLDKWAKSHTSLTKALKQHYAHFKVEVLFEGYHQKQWERVVLLYGDHQPVVFAVSMLPAKWLHHPVWRYLRFLRNKPMGEKLFAYPTMRRYILSYFYVNNQLGRWSRFWYQNTYLDLIEIFLVTK